MLVLCSNGDHIGLIVNRLSAPSLAALNGGSNGTFACKASLYPQFFTTCLAFSKLSVASRWCHQGLLDLSLYKPLDSFDPSDFPYCFMILDQLTLGANPIVQKMMMIIFSISMIAPMSEAIPKCTKLQWYPQKITVWNLDLTSNSQPGY